MTNQDTLTQLVADANDACTFAAAEKILRIAVVELLRLPAIRSTRDLPLDLENVVAALSADARDARASAKGVVG